MIDQTPLGGEKILLGQKSILHNAVRLKPSNTPGGLENKKNRLKSPLPIFAMSRVNEHVNFVFGLSVVVLLIGVWTSGLLRRFFHSKAAGLSDFCLE